MSKRDIKSKERFLTIIILLISGLGFIAGIFYNTTETEANAKYGDAAEYELSADSMTLFVQSLYESDKNSFESANIAFMEARTLTTEWLEILLLGLPPDMESLENATHKRQILGKLWEGWNLQADSTVMSLWNYFNSSNGAGARTLANYFTHRFVYIITGELWKSYNDTYPNLIPFPAVTFINETVGGVSEGILNEITGELSDLYLFEFNESSYQNMLNDPLFEARNLAVQTLQDANLLAGQANSLGITVSFTTVAVVLSSAMSGRIDKKKLERYISQVRADIQKNDSLISGGKDRLASIGLFLALIIAITGFLMTIPTWFGII
ncbi:MAG: hypothetical protein ACFFA0_14080 [Promethearchaeota archaeon]